MCQAQRAHGALPGLALLKEGRGVYRVHPSVMWRGELAKRGQAEAGAPVLTLVGRGREDDQPRFLAVTR